MKLRWTRRAEPQLVEIGRFIARDKPEAARRWIEGLLDSAFPGRGIPPADA